MKLWIRSQDREMLYKTNELYLDFKICEELGINEYYVNVNHETFGTYKTKERALEVLDEIHQRLINLQCIEITGANYITNQMKRNGIDCVYEMPKE